MTAFGALLWGAAPVMAMTINVNSTADLALGGGGSCPGTCTLRAAIQTANASIGFDDINVPAGTYTLAITGAGEDAAATGDLDVTDSVEIDGGGGGVTVDGDAIDRVFHFVAGNSDLKSIDVRNGSVTDDFGAGILVDGAARLEYENSTISANAGGGTTSNGGGIAVGTETNTNATLVLTTVRVENNAATQHGGGVYVALDSQATIVNSVFKGNAALDGGGLFVRTGPSNLTEVRGTTLTENTADSRGGGVYTDVCGVVEIRNSTIDKNSAAGNGGGLYTSLSFVCQTKLTLSNVTVAYNAAGGGGTGDGGGLYTDGTGFFQGVSTVGNTLLAWNFDYDDVNTGYVPDCGGRFGSGGHNLIQNQTGCNIVGDTTGNRPNYSNPNIGFLANNSGPTPTIALYLGSDGINTGNAAGGAGTMSCEATDQRGVGRPIGSYCDIGAFEAPICGNGTIEFPEACDGGGTCDAYCQFADPAATHNEPKSAAKTSGNLVTAYSSCSAGNLHTITPPTPTRTACTAVQSDTGCGFASSGSPITGTYSIEPLTSTGDVRIKVELKDLLSSCNGQTLTVYTSLRETTQSCPLTGGGLGSCTVTEGLLQDLNVGSCTVTAGNCTVDVYANTASSIPDFIKGRRTGLEIQSLVVKRGALVSFVPGILLP